MSDLNDDFVLSQITMPGSHDAGIYNADAVQTGVFKPSLSKTVCQSGTIYQQCEAGSRFFDIRFKVHAGKVKTYHTFAKQGAVGGNLDTVLTHVDEFLRANPTEFIILRLSHTMGCADQITQTAQQYSINNRLYTRRGNIAKHTIGDLRGHVILACDSTFNLDPTQGIHNFSKYEPGAKSTQGIITCGKYSDKSSIRNVFSKQVKRIDEHQQHYQHDHLFVLYWTQTGGKIRQHTLKPVNIPKATRKHRATGGAHHNMDYMLNVLTHGGARYQESWGVKTLTWQDRRDCMPNVIMYDFVNTATSAQIVTLNDPQLQAILEDQADEYVGEGIRALFN